MKHDDQWGMFWEDPDAVSARRGPDPNRPLPPTPDTGWKLPTEFPDLRGQGMIAVDIESKDEEIKTKGCGAFRDDCYICGVSIGTEAGYRQYFPVAHRDGPNLDKGRVFDWLSTQLSRPGQAKVGANLKYDYIWLKTSGVKLCGPYYDVQIAEPLLNENRLQYGLQALALDYLGEGKEDDAMYQWLKDAFGDITNIKRYIWKAPPAVVGPYAESDVDLPLRILKLQRQQLKAEGLEELFEMESKLLPFLGDMFIRGVPIDKTKAGDISNSLEERLQARIADLKKEAGVDIDIWKADSLAKLYDAKGIAYPLSKKKQQPSFTKEWLKASPDPVSKMVMDVRGFEKFKTTFVDGYLLDKGFSGIIHTTFNQLKGDDGGAISGRLSSSTPNMQNIPVNNEDGKLIRAAFIPEEGCDWWGLDWSQIEYRLIAHYAYITHQRGAEHIVNEYINNPGVDYHQIVADMTNLMRWQAKNLNFGLAYGQGVALLCRNLNVDEETGRRIINTYHDKAPFIRPLMRMVSERIEDQGMVKTIMGRRRRFVVWEKKDRFTGEMIYQDHYEPGFRLAKLHKGLNALIQGSAADLMKSAMVQIAESGALNIIGVPHLTVHDELDFSVPRTKAGLEAIREVQYIMENVIKLTVPLKADAKQGANWCEAH